MLRSSAIRDPNAAIADEFEAISGNDQRVTGTPILGGGYSLVRNH